MNRLAIQPLAIALAVAIVLVLGTLRGVNVERKVDPATMAAYGPSAVILSIKPGLPVLRVRDETALRLASPTVVLEDGNPLATRLGDPTQIARHPGGAYSHYRDDVIFTASDGSDPRVNGRTYQVRYSLCLRWQVALVMASVGSGLVVLWAMLARIRRWSNTLNESVRRVLAFRPDASARALSAASARHALALCFLAAGLGTGAWYAAGPLMWLALAGGTATIIVAIARSWTALLCWIERPPRLGWTVPSAMVVLSMGLTAAIFETGLWALERLQVGSVMSPPPTAPIPPAVPSGGTFAPGGIDPVRLVPPEILQKAAIRQDILTMPPEWVQTPTDIPGASRAYVWHGALHVFDQDRMRRADAIPAKRPGSFRILIFGDSLTYGMGLEETHTYPAVLQRLMNHNFAEVEILNMGVSGFQSEDVLAAMRKWVPRLSPDAVVYGVCLNDYLPSGVGQYIELDAYGIPLPKALKERIIATTRLGKMLDTTYDGMLRKLHLRKDFYDDIINNFDGFQNRFAHDVATMNKIVTDHALPPVTAMVLEQFPDAGTRSHRLAMTTERYLAEGGMEVISIDPYIRHYTGRVFPISRWEGHPNEEANAIFATMLAERLGTLPGLGTYRRTDQKP